MYAFEVALSSYVSEMNIQYEGIREAVTRNPMNTSMNVITGGNEAIAKSKLHIKRSY